MVGERGDETLEALKREQRKLFDDMTALEEDYQARRIDKKTRDKLSASQWEELTEIQRRINAIQPRTTTVMKCQYCGAENPESNKFCGDCGEILPRSQTRSSVYEPTTSGEYPVHYRGKARTGYLVGGGLTAAIFFGLFYWATNFTYTERVWIDLGYGYGFWQTVERTIDPAIQALLLVVAIIGLIAMAFGAVSRK